MQINNRTQLPQQQHILKKFVHTKRSFEYKFLTTEEEKENNKRKKEHYKRKIRNRGGHYERI